MTVIVHRTHNENGQRVNSSTEFFNSLHRGHVVKIGRFGSPLVYTGNWRESMMRHTVFLVTQELSEPFFVDLDNDASEWIQVTDPGNNLPIMVSPETCSAIDQYIAEWKGNQNLHEVITKLRNDIQTINRLLNEYAEENSMCNEYENTLQDWNKSLSEQTTLVGRMRDRDVKVRVRAEWDVWVTVQGTSADDVKEKVENMDVDDVFTLVRDIQSYPDTIEVRDVEV